MTLTRLLGALGLAFSFLALTPAPSFACSCAHMSTDSHVRTADLIVRGVVAGRTPDSADTVRYAVDVTGVYKGRASRDLEVRSAASGASCGLENVALGREHVVFANTEGTGEIWANLCGGTAPATPALVEDVERVTGAPRPPADGAPADGSTGGGTDQADEADRADRAEATASRDGTEGPPTWAWLTGAALLIAAAAGAMLRTLVRPS
jgi:hypothetical protein